MAQGWASRGRDFFDERPDVPYTFANMCFSLSYALFASVANAFMLQRGLTMAQYGAWWATMLATLTVLNFPTGALADRYGRVRLYAAGMVVTGVGRVVLATSHGFPQFMAAAVLCGAGESQVSGSVIAWLADRLNARGRGAELPRVFGTAIFVSDAVAAAGGLIVGFAYRNAPAAALAASAGVAFLAAGLMPFLVRDNRGSATAPWTKLGLSSLRFFLGSRALFAVTAVQIAVWLSYGVFNLAWQPVGVALGIVTGQLGYVYALYRISAGLGNYCAGQLERRVGWRWLLWGLAAVCAAGLWLFGRAPGILAYGLGVVLFGVSYGGFTPLLVKLAQSFFPGTIRASMTSLLNTIAALATAASQGLIGVGMGRFGVGFAGLLGVPLMVCLSLGTLALRPPAPTAAETGAAWPGAHPRAGPPAPD